MKFFCLFLSFFFSFSVFSEEMLSPIEILYKETQTRAVEYKLARADFIKQKRLTGEYDKQAEEAVFAVKILAEAGEWKSVWKLASNKRDDFEYSSFAADLAGFQVRALLNLNKYPRAGRYLVELWYFFPGYKDINSLCSSTIDRLEKLQGKGFSVDFEIEEPDDFFTVLDGANAYEVDLLLYFLSEQGDRKNVSPRATLALARMHLLESEGVLGKGSLIASRFYYEQFITKYSDSKLLFDAVCEYSISYMITYRGDRFDAGALSTAKTIVDQAAFYTKDDQSRIEKIRNFRKILLHWQQMKEYKVAKWYLSKGYKPSGIHYLKKSIKKNNNSKLAREAKILLEQLQK